MEQRERKFLVSINKQMNVRISKHGFVDSIDIKHMFTEEWLKCFCAVLCYILALSNEILNKTAHLETFYFKGVNFNTTHRVEVRLLDAE